MKNTEQSPARMAVYLQRATGYVLCVLFSLIIFTPVVTAHAQKPTPSDDEVNAIARQLFCPVCENTPLDVCPTEACHNWRELIRQMLADGKTPDEVKQYFVDYYGARVLSEPPRSGLNWLVYVVPPLAFLVGVYLLFRAFQSWKRPTKDLMDGADPKSDLSSREAAAPGPDDDYVVRLEEELRKRK